MKKFDTEKFKLNFQLAKFKFDNHEFAAYVVLNPCNEFGRGIGVQKNGEFWAEFEFSEKNVNTIEAKIKEEHPAMKVEYEDYQ